MNYAAILGCAGTVVGLTRALPQLLSILRSGKANGVSPDSAATSAVVSFGWAVYGLLTSQPFVALATGASGTVFLLITFFALHSGRRIREVKLAPVWLLVLISAFLLKKETGLGIVLPVSILMSNIPQIYVAAREKDLTDLSLGTWILSLSDGAVWGMYSIIQLDYSIMVFAVLQLVTSGTIVVLKQSNSKRTGSTVVKGAGRGPILRS